MLCRKPNPRLTLCLAVASVLLSPLLGTNPGQAGERLSGYRALEPIRNRNLTIFPVVAASSHDTSEFLTLDEGLRSGEVVVTEAGRVPPLMRRPVRRRPLPPYPVPQYWQERPYLGGQQGWGDQVNRLALVNNSDRPLILLAGEIVTGGKQDRIVGKDRIVPPKSDPIDLSVFCVEPHRWVETSSKFGGMNFLMAQPSVRQKAMAEKNQEQVWDQVSRSSAAVAESAPGAIGALRGTSSYAGVMENQEVQQQVEAVAAPLEHSYENVIRELRARKAVGVVVAVNGQIIWADVFASTALLEQYWPKLIRSYAAEALTVGPRPVRLKGLDVAAAQAFLDDFQGRRESVESEPGVYRNTEIDGDGFTAFELASLLPGTGFDVHIAKMTE